MSDSQRFYDLLFEVSNEYRHGILLLLMERAMRLTDLTRELVLTMPEVRRHISRLAEVGLTERNVEGFYTLTPYGEMTLLLLRELDFISRYGNYFVSHSPTHLPQEYLKRIGDLENCEYTDNVMDFLHFIENGIREAEEHVWLQVDQYPLTALAAIFDAINRGVQFRILEAKEGAAGPLLDLGSPEGSQLARTRHTPLVEQRTLERVDVFQFISEKSCALAFPSIDDGFDYKGFKAGDERSLVWSKELFQRYWDISDQKVHASPTEYIRQARALVTDEASHDRVVVEGHDDSRVDAQAVQDAVDNFDEVILRGTFNFGATSVKICRSVTVKGEGREGDIPSSEIYKKGWIFPFTEYDRVFLVDGEGVDVTIENIHFTDFNCTCIDGQRGSSLNIKNNRITLETGYGRGMIFGAFGDLVIGIQLVNHEGVGNFPNGVNIMDNYIDFARGGARGGYITRGGIEDDPDYRPDLPNHEYYIGIGIVVNHALGKAIIKNNTVRNTNARGIMAYDNMASTDVRIRHNIVESDVYGSYAFYGPDAGVGILAQSGFSFPEPGFNVEITDNTIKLEKLNHCGIAVLGPVIDREGIGKLIGGAIRGNNIHLNCGYVGIHIRKSDAFVIADNEISGEAYYGIMISGRRKSGDLDLKAYKNLVEDNDLNTMEIRSPDRYSDSHVDGRMFTGSEGKSATAHVWLNTYSKENDIKLKAGETVIDEGEDNIITNVKHEETSQ